MRWHLTPLYVPWLHCHESHISHHGRHYRPTSSWVTVVVRSGLAAKSAGSRGCVGVCVCSRVVVWWRWYRGGVLAPCMIVYRWRDALPLPSFKLFELNSLPPPPPRQDILIIGGSFKGQAAKKGSRHTPLLPVSATWPPTLFRLAACPGRLLTPRLPRAT